MEQYYLDNMVLGMKIYNFLHRYAVNGKISGNLACIAEIRNTAVVLYGPRGCGFHYRYNVRSRNMPFYDLECADLRNKEVIFGGGEKLTELLLKIEKEKAPEIIFVLPSVVSDVLNDDLEGLVKSLQPQFKARLLAVASQVFSHMDKSNSLKAVREKANQGDGKKFSPSATYPGCGYVEVMNTLVEKVMEPQALMPESVNIETFVWGYDGYAKIRAMAELLKKMGIKVNSFLPAADLDSIRCAPRAALNIVRRKKWAMAMEQRFGTPYLHIADMQEWHGISGISDLYCEIGDILGCRARVDKVLAAEKAAVMPRYLALRRKFSQYKFCLIAGGLAALPDTIRIYEADYGLPLSKICLTLHSAYQTEMGIDNKLLSKFTDRIESAKAACDSKAEVILNPSDRQLKETVQSCDYVICSGQPRYAALGTPVLYNLVDRSVWTFNGFMEIMEEIDTRLDRAEPLGEDLLLAKAAYDPNFYPLRAADKNSLASRDMFSRIWRQRGR